MAKKVSNRNSNLVWMKKHRVLSLLLVILVLFLGFSIYNKILAIQEKKEFEKARVAIEALYADIEKQVGKPDKTIGEQKCRYASAKFEKGRLSCRASIYFVYSVSDNNEATSIANKIFDYTSSSKNNFNLTFTDRNQYLPFPAVSSKSTNQNVLSRYTTEDITNPNCYISQWFGFADKIDGVLFLKHLSSSKSNYNLLVELSCNGEAKAEHYPVKD